MTGFSAIVPRQHMENGMQSRAEGSVIGPDGRLINPFIATKNCVIVIEYMLDALRNKPELRTEKRKRAYGPQYLAEDITELTRPVKFDNKFMSNLREGHLIVNTDQYEALCRTLPIIAQRYG